ncbi:hypothetical protein JYQ62_11075 [Nostoc sp. UHCC 0702]|nr:hypothetical protein JYQ62_11075 [Nostoc sp. UHCC 0702]
MNNEEAKKTLENEVLNNIGKQNNSSSPGQDRDGDRSLTTEDSPGKDRDGDRSLTVEDSPEKNTDGDRSSTVEDSPEKNTRKDRSIYKRYAGNPRPCSPALLLPCSRTPLLKSCLNGNLLLGKE